MKRCWLHISNASSLFFPFFLWLAKSSAAFLTTFAAMHFQALSIVSSSSSLSLPAGQRSLHTTEAFARYATPSAIFRPEEELSCAWKYEETSERPDCKVRMELSPYARETGLSLI